MKRYPVKLHGLPTKTGSGRRSNINRLCRISDSIGPIVSKIPDFDLAMEIAWATSLGQNLASHTKLVGIQDGVLVVEASDESWRQALLGMSKTILKRLQSTLAERAPVKIEVIVLEHNR